MRNALALMVSILAVMALPELACDSDDPGFATDTDTDTDTDSDTDSDSDGDCECFENSDCCDGCNAINEGDGCEDDDLNCTDDVCVIGTCTHEIRDGFCLIEGECHYHNANNPETLCQYCDTLVSNEMWTNREGDTTCDDGDPCTVGDVCDDMGGCSGELAGCGTTTDECCPDGCNESNDADCFGEACAAGGNWFDAISGYCWQEPPSASTGNWFHASGTEDDTYNPVGFVSYCGNLVVGGYEDWRLPSIEELTSLIRGCVDGVATGDLSLSTCEPDGECAPCPEGEGPGVDGCYWHPDLNGTCAEYWSATGYPGYADDVQFQFGQPRNWYTNQQEYVRCIRTGPWVAE